MQYNFKIKLLNKFIWRCPTKRLLEFYDINISHNHLDVGVGNAYYLDRARFFEKPYIALLDINSDALARAAKRIARYQPICYQADIMQPLNLKLPKFDSISINNVLHCLPGNFYDKEIVFKNLSALLRPHGILFGSTILGDKSKTNLLGKKIVDYYNANGILHNNQDRIEDLKHVLARNFETYTLYEVGIMALFIGRSA